MSLSLATGSVLVTAPRASRAQAARTFTWTGSGGNSNWETNANWDSNLYPDSTTTAVSFLTGVANTLAYLNASHKLYGITFGYNSSNTATSFTISAGGTSNTLSLYAGGITNNTTLTQTIDAPLALQTSQSFSTVSGGTLAFTAGANNQINLQGNALTIGGAGNTGIASKIVDTSDNPANLIKTGTGTLTLSNLGNSFTGNLAISQGTVVAGAAQTSYNPSTSVLGSTQTSMRTITVGDSTNAATLNFAASQVFGTGNSNPTVGLVVNAGSTITNSGGQFNILPNITLNGGTLTGTGGMSATQQMYSFAFGTITVGGSAMSTISGSGANSGYHLGGSTTFNVADVTSAGDGTDLLVSGNLIDNFNSNGAGSLVKTGAGMMTLTGANTYTGTTTINGGTLNVGNGTTSSSLGNGTGTVTINIGALNFYASSSAGNATINNNRFINFYASSSAGSASINNNYSINFYASSSAGSASIINNHSDSLNFNDSSSAGNATITNNLTLMFFKNSSTAGNATINNNSFLSFNDSSTAGNATINNNNEIDFNGTSSADNAIINNNSGALDLSQHSGGLSIGELSGAGPVSLGGNSLTVGGLNTSDTISGRIGDGGNNKTTGGSLVKIGNGFLTLTGNNTYTGGTTINAGYLAVGTNTTGSSLGSGLITNNSVLYFYGSSSVGNASIVNNSGGTISFNTNSSAGNTGTSLANSGNVIFSDQSSTGGATITNSNGASLYLLGTSTAGSANIANGGGATLDISRHSNNLSVGELSGAGAVYLGGNTLTVGGAVTSSTTSDTISGVIQDGGYYGGTGGSLVKIGSGTLALTGANTYTGGTTINSGTVVAGGTALGTAAATIASGATLSVGEAPNATNAAIATHSLSITSLAVTLGSPTPLLTFSLGNSGVSDVLNLTGTGNELTFSGSGAFTIGFASATGGSLGAGTYNLFSFATPEAMSSAPTLNSYFATPVGNLGKLRGGSSGSGTFAYVTNAGGQVTGLQYSITGSDALPEPSSLAFLLLAPGTIGAVLGLSGRLVTRRRRGSGSRSAHSDHTAH